MSAVFANEVRVELPAGWIPVIYGQIQEGDRFAADEDWLWASPRWDIGSPVSKYALVIRRDPKETP